MTKAIKANNSQGEPVGKNKRVRKITIIPLAASEITAKIPTNLPPW